MKVGWLNELWPNQIVQYSAATTEDTVGKYVTTQNWCGFVLRPAVCKNRVMGQTDSLKTCRSKGGQRHSQLYLLCFSFLFKHL